MPTQVDIRQRVARDFICEKHIRAIERASAISNCSISFRLAGAATISALNFGAAAKGHNILEKTVKESSLAKVYSPTQAREILQAVRKAGIEGCVGHWDATGLVGIYLSCEREEDASIYKIDVNDLDRSLIQLKKNNAWQRKVFTGDYDAHDIITFRGAGRPRTVLEGSLEEQQIIDCVNREIARDDEYRPFALRQYNVLRHGPQVNYFSYMLRRERGSVDATGGVVGAVAKPGDFPVAAVRRSSWTIINNVVQLGLYYKSLGAVMKESWQADGVRFFEDKAGRPGIVNLGRKSI